MPIVQSAQSIPKNNPVWSQLLVAGLLLMLSSGCSGFSKAEAESKRPSGAQQGNPAVDVAIARTDSLQKQLEYTGTTQPVREVSVRAQIEGRLLNLNVDVGDSVQQGQVLGQLDDAIPLAAVSKAEADVAAQQSEVAQAEAELGNIRTQVERARLELQQARSDAARTQQLLREGAISAQQAETDRTTARTAEQAFRSAQAQIKTQQQAVTAAQKRVTSQQAIVNQESERRSYTVLKSPVTGAVLQRVTEPGNLAQAGSEVLKLGDFSRAKIAVQVSELELGTIRVGQPVQVRLDAYPNQQFEGQVSRISPAADPTARLVPIEVTLPNSERKIRSGLLARVNFARSATQRVVVPEAAIQTPKGQDNSNTGTLFTVNGKGDQAKVVARSVKLGQRSDGKVEILSGLQPGESFVARGNRNLKDGDSVRLSFLSEKPQQSSQ